MAREADQAHCPVSTGRPDGRGGEAGTGGAGGAAEAAGGDREHRGRRGEHRSGLGGEVDGGRVHAVRRQQHHGQPDHAGQQEAQLRSAEVLSVGVKCGGAPDGARVGSLGAREERGGCLSPTNVTDR